VTITTTITADELDRPVVWGDDLVDIGGLAIVGDPATTAAALRRCADRLDTAMRTAGPGFHSVCLMDVGLLQAGDLVDPCPPFGEPPAADSPHWCRVVDVCPLSAGGPPASVVTLEHSAPAVWRHDRAVWAMRAHRHDHDAATHEIGPAA
jgi:hypothetical protein